MKSDMVAFENKVIGTMIEMYCKAHHHHSGSMCADCAELADYCKLRNERCPLGNDKKSCRKCAIHCYDPLHRERIRAVMRYSGAKMMFCHPIMAIRHLWHEVKR